MKYGRGGAVRRKDGTSADYARRANRGFYKVWWKLADGTEQTDYTHAVNRVQAWNAIKARHWPGGNVPPVKSKSVQKVPERGTQ